jgi:N-formylglutamate amidohydrolase
MSDAIFELQQGESPLLISVPHDGRALPPDIAQRMTTAAQTLPDTDWHVARLYDFARELGASIITARYSRYVVDLNRPPDDHALYPRQLTTGICPAQSFDGARLYLDGSDVTPAEQRARIDRYWRPYHEGIAKLLDERRTTHGYALLWDAHSIASEVPGLFDGELPVLNLGTNRGLSCASAIEAALAQDAYASPYSAVCNGRFTGGYITRHFGRPDEQLHAVQLELAQRSYMDEKTLRYDSLAGEKLQAVLRKLLQTFSVTAQQIHA